MSGKLLQYMSPLDQPHCRYFVSLRVVIRHALEEQNEELEVLNVEAHELEARIAENVAKLMEAGG